MPSRPTLLLIMSLPLGAVVYTAAARVMEEIFPKEPILSLLVPLFVAGVAMMPLLIPFFDRKAKEDLAEYKRQQVIAGEDASAPDAPDEANTPSGEPEDPDPPTYDGHDATGGTDR